MLAAHVSLATIKPIGGMADCARRARVKIARERGAICAFGPAAHHPSCP